MLLRYGICLVCTCLFTRRESAAAVSTVFVLILLPQEMIHRPPYLARERFRRCRAPFRQCMICAPRCYCMLTHYPFFDMHFQASAVGGLAIQAVVCGFIVSGPLQWYCSAWGRGIPRRRIADANGQARVGACARLLLVSLMYTTWDLHQCRVRDCCRCQGGVRACAWAPGMLWGCAWNVC